MVVYAQSWRYCLAIIFLESLLLRLFKALVLRPLLSMLYCKSFSIGKSLLNHFLVMNYLSYKLSILQSTQIKQIEQFEQFYWPTRVYNYLFIYLCIYLFIYLFIGHLRKVSFKKIFIKVNDILSLNYMQYWLFD